MIHRVIRGLVLMLLGLVLDNLFLTTRGVAAVFLTSVSRGGELGLVMAAVFLTSVAGGQRADCECVGLGSQHGPVQRPENLVHPHVTVHPDRVPSEHNWRNEPNRLWRDISV